MSKQARTAHILEEKWRSKDVRLQEKADFSSMLLSDRVLAGLEKSGFKIPSPIQIESIPVGRFGRDLVVQAKSGTGKTLVFTVIALEALLDIKLPQVLIVAPTREIATQICDVIKSVGCEIKDLKCNSFIGGTPFSQDTEKCLGCQIVVGTPGRLRQLIDEGNLPMHSVRMLVLDEADELMERSFKTDIDFLFMTLPKEKQVIATSATYPKELKDFIRLYFRDAYLARLNVTKPALLGIVHYIHQVESSKMPHLAYQLKVAALEKILAAIQFTQCVVFCNLKTRVEPLCYDVRKWGFSAAFISSNKEQSDRLKAIDCLKKFRCKVLVSSDLTARGIDAEKVDMIINFETPYNLETYMHRCGRAGRYGSKGVVISFLTTDEINSFEKMKKEGRFQTYSLPDPVPPNLINIRAKELDFSNDDESSENEDSINESPQTKERIQNGKDLCETDYAIQDSTKNSLLKEGTFGPTESNGNVSEEKHILINDAESEVENNHSLKYLNSNESEINQKCIIDRQILSNNTSISVKSEKVCDVSEKSNCIQVTEEVVHDEVFDKTLPNGSFDDDNVNQSYISNSTKESQLLNDAQLCKDKNDINICNTIQEILHKESILKDLNGVEVENRVENFNLNALKEIEQKLQTINSDCENETRESINNADKQKSAVTFVSNATFIDNDLNSDINPITESKSEASISLETNNNLGLQLNYSDIKLKISKNSILDKIQLPIVQFLVDYDKKCMKERGSEKNNSLEKLNIKAAPKDILKSTKLIQSHQVKEVRKNLSNFYEKIFKSYQSKFVDEQTFTELKFALRPQSFHIENGITYEKVVLVDENQDKPDDASSVSSGFNSYQRLEEFMFQGNKSGNVKYNKKDTKDISTTSSSSSDSSSDSSDVEHYRELLHNKVKQQNSSSTAVHSAKRQSSNKPNGNRESQPDIKESCSFGKVSGDKSNFASYIYDDDDGRHGARRKTFFKNCQIQANVARKLSDEFSSDSEDSYSHKFTEVPPAKDHIPHVKKTKVKSSSKTMKDHKNVSPSKYLPYLPRYLPYYSYSQNYQSDPTYIPPAPVTSQNTHCSRHRCHVAGRSFCISDVCSDWYGIFQKQWKYIQMFSKSGHQIPLYY